MDNVIFISYSHQDQHYRAELAAALTAVGSIRDRVWVDQNKLDIGDQFHPEIQQALAGTRVALLLISNTFLTSDYIIQHELPYLLEQAERDPAPRASADALGPGGWHTGKLSAPGPSHLTTPLFGAVARR